jgi:hypothetical protein
MACKDNQHRYFVAETVGVEAEGKVVVILICTSCGEGKVFRVPVTDNRPARLIMASPNKEEKE